MTDSTTTGFAIPRRSCDGDPTASPPAAHSISSREADQLSSRLALMSYAPSRWSAGFNSGDVEKQGVLTYRRSVPWMNRESSCLLVGNIDTGLQQSSRGPTAM